MREIVLLKICGLCPPYVSMSELERNYRMIDALNRQSSEKIQSGELKLLEYDRAAIERVVHDYAEQQKIERERIKQQNC